MQTQIKPIAYMVYTTHGLYCYTTEEGEVAYNGEYSPLHLDIDWIDVAAAIAEAGWCGTYIDVEPVVIQPYSDSLDLYADAQDYLDQPR